MLLNINIPSLSYHQMELGQRHDTGEVWYKTDSSLWKQLILKVEENLWKSLLISNLKPLPFPLNISVIYAPYNVHSNQKQKHGSFTQ